MRTVGRRPDLSTREGIYEATGKVPRFAVGDKVIYDGDECEITGLGMEVGQIAYDNSLGKWGKEYQYQPAKGTA